MDKNKLQKLIEVGYRIAPSCGMCVYARIDPGKDWGECRYHGYRHLKHLTVGENCMSIHRAGSCRSFVGRTLVAEELHGFAVFREHRCTNFDSLQNQCQGVKRIRGDEAVCDVCGEAFRWHP